jgi:hypothetical protein
MSRRGFVTPERFAKDQAKKMVPTRGRIDRQLSVWFWAGR